MLTVIIPVYNAEAYLEKCVKSILDQTYKDYEILMVNDGSCDGSAEICNRLARDHKNIRVIHKENGGVAAARNTAIENVRGDLISLVDADDILDPQMFEIMISEMEKTGADIAACGYRMEYGSIHTKRYDTVPPVTLFTGQKELMCGMSNGITGFLWNKVIKRSALGTIRFREDAVVASDLLFVFELIQNIDKTVYIDLPFYHYRYIIGSLSKSRSLKAYMDCLSNLKKINDIVRDRYPESEPGFQRNFIFWNTKTCECMLNDYHPREFRQIQRYVYNSREYISGCGIRVRLLACAILRSWKCYHFFGKTFYLIKKLYVKMASIKG